MKNIGPSLHLVIIHVTSLFENYGLRKYLEEIFSKEPTSIQNLKSRARFTDSSYSSNKNNTDRTFLVVVGVGGVGAQLIF